MAWNRELDRHSRISFLDSIMVSIERDYLSGMNANKISKKHGVHIQSVLNRLRKMGHAPRFENGRATRGRYGPLSHNWKGGVVKNADGYLRERIFSDDPFFEAMVMPTWPRAYVPQHRIVMARHLGRPLEKHETVHHINGIRTDNRIENLQLRSGRHGKGVVYRCRCCGSHDIEAEPI